MAGQINKEGHWPLVKEQILHLFFGSLIFVLIGAVAVALDLAASGIGKLSVSTFTREALYYCAHALLVVDLVLFCVYVVASSIALLKTFWAIITDHNGKRV